VVDVSAKHAGDGRGGEELDSLATIVSASEARLAGTAGDVGLDGDPVAHLEMGDGGVHSDNLAGRLVAKDVVTFDDHRANATSMPEVNIGAIPW
jgi:hypothetical protein